MFNVGPVVTQEDGSVISLEKLRMREERLAAKKAEANTLTETTKGNINPDRLAAIDRTQTLSKTQQKKLAAYEPKPLPPKPVIPDSIPIPEGEENWVALWDIPDEEIERRIVRAKRKKASDRKALRVKQKSGKEERRAARDEKRKVYRDLKMTWKSIKLEEKKLKTLLKAAEDEEAKKIAVKISTSERRIAMQICESLGFTLANTPGVDDIKPKVSGMKKGQSVDLDAIEPGGGLNDVKIKDPSSPKGLKRKRVDLSAVATSAEAYIGPETKSDSEDLEEFIKLDTDGGQDHEALVFNHKLRRKLRRAIDAADILKERLVRDRAIEFLTDNGLEPPPELLTPLKPIHLRGARSLEDGTLETEKAERVRIRLELAEFNKAAKVLRRQAKKIAAEAGLRVYAERTGRIPPMSEEGIRDFGPGWVVPAEKPPKDLLKPEDVMIL
jgi:hypothetical protein